MFRNLASLRNYLGPAQFNTFFCGDLSGWDDSAKLTNLPGDFSSSIELILSTNEERIAYSFGRGL